MTPPGGSAKPFAYRRYARECAVHALYLAEFSKISMLSALAQTLEAYDDPEFLAESLPNGAKHDETTFDRFKAFATQVANGVWEDKYVLDERIADAIPGYDFSRLASIDKNVLRLATWELLNLDYVPPAVTLNEAIEIVKKYSTAESGKFVNGVLATILRGTPKANWDPKAAPKDPELSSPEKVYKEPEKVVEAEVVQEGTEEAKIASRYGVWKLRSDEDEA